MRLAGVALHGDTAVGKQRLTLAGVIHHPFGAEPGIGMFGKLAGQLADAVSDIGDRVAIRQRGKQIQRGGREVQGALAAADNHAAQAALVERQPAEQSGEAAADDGAIKLHPDAPFVIRTGRDRPSG